MDIFNAFTYEVLNAIGIRGQIYYIINTLSTAKIVEPTKNLARFSQKHN
ncbi:hypothetical protein [Riemerella anatipestifer]|nr:hypothetical protein [Riemerella anatipestifer]